MRRTTCWTCLIVVAAVTLGCERSQTKSPLDTNYQTKDATAELDFWHGLADRRIVSNNEMAHGLIELANQTDPNETYDQRIAWLKSKDLLDGGFNGAANSSAERGTLAQILCRILDIKGGVTMRLIGAHPRYALRELTYMEIMPTNSSPQQGLSGIEFVGVINKAEAYSEDNL